MLHLPTGIRSITHTPEVEIGSIPETEYASQEDTWSHHPGNGTARSTAQAKGFDALTHRILEPRPPIAPHDLGEVQRELERLEHHPAVEVEHLGDVDGKPIHVLRAGAEEPELNVTIVAGVHGNEPGGPAAGFALVQRLLEDEELRSRVRITFVPVANPGGWEEMTRRNPKGLNINRTMHAGDLDPNAPEAAILRRALDSSNADLALDLHGSKSVGKTGFFGLHRGNSLDLLKTAMQRFAKKFPILQKSTERYELDAPGVGVSRNTGTVKDYMVDVVGAEWSMTLEAPVLFDYETQVEGLAALSEHVLREALARKSAASA